MLGCACAGGGGGGGHALAAGIGTPVRLLFFSWGAVILPVPHTSLQHLVNNKL